MYKKSYSVLFLLLMFFCVNAQKFTPDTSKSGNLFRAAKVMTGFVNGIYPSLPLITTVIPSTSGVDPKGTQIYVTGDSTFYIWSGTQWIGIVRNNINWSLTGNNGTVAGTNFIGTKDAIDWVIKTNNTERARVTSSGTATFVKDALVNGLTVGRGSGNISFNSANGSGALSVNTTGSSNTANGYATLNSNTTGENNTAVGASALFANTTGVRNTATGVNSLVANTIGVSNTATGMTSLAFNTSGNYNSAFGSEALYTNTTGVENTALGYQSLFSNTTGSDNMALGVGALKLNTTGANNVAVGTSAMLAGTANGNTAIGVNSLRAVTGDNNTAVGFQSDITLTSGTNNIRIGVGGTGVTTGDNNVLIGDFTSTISAATSNHVEIRDGDGNLAFKRDISNNITIPVQTINNDTTNNKIVVQNTTTGRLGLSNWNASAFWLTGDIKQLDVSNAYIAANFDGTGLGINERAGWAICNGNNGTKNRNGRVSIAYGTSYLVMGATGGSETHTLTANELPTIGENLRIVQITGNNTFTVGDASPGEYDLKDAADWPGAGAAHNIMQPYIVTLFIQKL